MVPFLFEMIRQFVPAEFYVASLRSWLTQFQYAMEMTKTHPKVALMYLVDTDYDRWKTICHEIENIDDVVAAIEFLDDSLDDDSLDMVKGCCSPQRRKIKRTIEVAKLAALPRRQSEAAVHIKNVQQQIKKLKRTQTIMNELIRKLHHKIEPIRIKLQKYPRGMLPPETKSESNQLNDMTKQIIKMEKSRRETTEKIKILTAERNVWKNYMSTLQPYPKQNMEL